MKNTILILGLALTAAMLLPMISIEWTAKTADNSSLLSTEAQTPDPAPACSSLYCSDSPHFGLFNASEASAAGYACEVCFSRFDSCMSACDLETDTAGEVPCQNICINALIDCLGTCSF